MENKIIEKINKLSLPVVILTASIILGGFLYFSQTNKQHFIEGQQQIKAEQEKQDQLTIDIKEQQLFQKQQEKKLQLDTCLAQAEQKKNDNILYWQNYYKKNCINEPNINATIWCGEETIKLIDKAKAEAEVDKNECYTRYK